jgi:hypothetical protein
MSETPLSERQAGLLAVVAEGGGDWDARRIDLTADARSGPGPGTVLRELEELQRLGWSPGTTAARVPAAGGR